MEKKDIKFYHKEKVKVKKGFYTGYIGTIEDYTFDLKTKDVKYSVNILGLEKFENPIFFSENEIRLLSFFEKIREWANNYNKQRK